MKNRLRSKLIFSLLFVQLFLSVSVFSQSITLSSAVTGEYSSNQSITLLPGFSTSGPFRAYITSMLSLPLASAPSQQMNYVLTNTAKQAGFTTADQLNSAGVTTAQVSQVIQYVDGLGRPLQTIQTKGSPTGKDIVQPMAYDAFGREALKYLPYAEQSGDGSYRSTALGTQAAFYSSSGWDASVIKTPAPFSQTIFEASPLNKLIEQGAPGSVWQPAAGQRDNSSGRTILISEAVNNSSVNYATDGYAVRLWKASANTNASYKRDLSTSGYYSAGELFVKISKDENWLATDGKVGTVEEYTDKEGHVVLKRLFNLKDGNVQVLSTYYVYDDLGNLSFVLTSGASPDGGSIDQTALDLWCYQYRYDGRKRLVEKKIPGKGWEYMVYNQLDQLVLSQDAVQHAAGQWMFSKYDALGRTVVTGVYNDASGRISLAATVAADTVLYESRPSGSANYSNLAFPQSIAHYHNIQYYDDYSFAGASSYVYSGSSRTKGLQTGSRTGVLGTDDLLLSVNYYDEEGRVAKVFKQHYQSGAVNVGNYDEITNSYNFEGALTASNRVHHNASSGSTTIATHYDYDHVGRKLRTYEQIGGGADVLLVESRYNEIGQLKEKGLGGGLQNTVYSYNERGWLKGSNSNVFSLQLKYEDGEVPQFNGNISGQLWGNGATTDQSFSYSYDKLNRLLNGTATGMSEILSYDVMGNISSLNRDGLVRSYVYSGNQLLKTTGVATVADYAYDLNGNATVDGRTGKSFTYNVLNLPETVSGGLSYVYDAAGSKLKKTSGSNVTDYIDGIQYTNGAIELIQTEAGIARRNGSGYSYEYNLSDHLGNNRLTFYKNPNGSLEVLQRDDYYAFGLRKSVQGSSTENKYLYNGKELQDELGQYDYGARFYDPVIGRWTVVDPLAELSRSYSPFTYGNNNPIRFIDPDGMKTTDADGNTHSDNAEEAQAIFRQLQGQLSSQNEADPKKTEQGYTPVPQDYKKKGLPGFPGSKLLPSKNGARPSWDLGGLKPKGAGKDTPKMPKGAWGEWDSQHGEVEVYNKNGEHQGAWDPESGEENEGKQRDKRRPTYNRYESTEPDANQNIRTLAPLDGQQVAPFRHYNLPVIVKPNPIILIGGAVGAILIGGWILIGG